jgi:hypothetical protein
MSAFVEATLVGYFPDDVLLELSRPLNGFRFRQVTTTSEGYVANLLTGAFRNTDSDYIAGEIEKRLGDFSAVLVLDDDHHGSRTITYSYGKIWDDSGFGDD